MIFLWQGDFQSLTSATIKLRSEEMQIVSQSQRKAEAL